MPERVFRNQAGQTQRVPARNDANCQQDHLAEANGAEGEVSLDAVIGKDGRILSLGVRSGEPVFAKAALAAVRQWAYRPLKINGTPVEVATDIDVLVKRP